MTERADELLLSREDTKSGRLQRIALDYIRLKDAKGEIPTSIRFLFYELEQRGDISKERRAIKPGCKTARTMSQDLTVALTHLREQGLVPWDWIVDDSRRLYDWERASSVLAFVQDQIWYARLDLWAGTRMPVIVSEAKTVGGVLARRLAPEYLVPIVPITGQCRGFLETAVADLLRDPNTRVLYIGDADDAGDDIEANARRVLVRATGREFDSDTWERLALTSEQVVGLRTRGVEPVLKRDDRYNDGNPHEAFECEALGQTEIERLVRERLDQLLPEPLEVVRARETEQRSAVLDVLDQIASETD